MNTNSKRLGIYLAIMILATAIATTLRTVACLNQLDYASGFFLEKSLIGAADAIIAITVIGMFSYLFVAARIHLRASFSTGATYVPTGILAVASAFLGAKTFSYVSDSTNGMFFRFTQRTPRGLLLELFTAKNIASLIGLVVCELSIAYDFCPRLRPRLTLGG